MNMQKRREKAPILTLLRNHTLAGMFSQELIIPVVKGYSLRHRHENSRKAMRHALINVKLDIYLCSVECFSIGKAVIS